jgi:glycosyltransferase involved in cell wall biosynthesis
MGIVVGIDASRNRSGGAKVHLRGILQSGSPAAHGIDTVHVWSYRSLLAALPDAPWLVKHNPPALEGSLLRQVWWQYHRLPKEAAALGCSVLLNTDAGSVCPFRPAAVMSRDMLSYEPGEMRRYGFSKARLRLILLRYIQAISLRRADAAIFLTNHAANVIQTVTGPLPHVSIIPHGLGAGFRRNAGDASWPRAGERSIRCLYVSNAAMYKHQWNVVRAIGALRKRGIDVSLVLAGGGSGPAQRLLDRAIAETDARHEFVHTLGFVEHEKLPALLASADLFVFASSCENMPNTLVEAMAAGLPIACSDRGPMPEILEDGGVYFDPENVSSIADSIARIVADAGLRKRLAARARSLSDQYSWEICAGQTWALLRALGEAVPASALHRAA